MEDSQNHHDGGAADMLVGLPSSEPQSQPRSQPRSPSLSHGGRGDFPLPLNHPLPLPVTRGQMMAVQSFHQLWSIYPWEFVVNPHQQPSHWSITLVEHLVMLAQITTLDWARNHLESCLDHGSVLGLDPVNRLIEDAITTDPHTGKTSAPRNPRSPAYPTRALFYSPSLSPTPPTSTPSPYLPPTSSRHSVLSARTTLCLRGEAIRDSTEPPETSQGILEPVSSINPSTTNDNAITPPVLSNNLEEPTTGSKRRGCEFDANAPTKRSHLSPSFERRRPEIENTPTATMALVAEKPFPLDDGSSERDVLAHILSVPASRCYALSARCEDLGRALAAAQTEFDVVVAKRTLFVQEMFALQERSITLKKELASKDNQRAVVLASAQTITCLQAAPAGAELLDPITPYPNTELDNGVRLLEIQLRATNEELQDRFSRGQRMATDVRNTKREVDGLTAELEHGRKDYAKWRALGLATESQIALYFGYDFGRAQVGDEKENGNSNGNGSLDGTILFTSPEQLRRDT
ncbi:hypothetical protein F5X98DRAFT_384948 [Xylaria grammica]|nr:hypothetical protein F5X98DRAFT_384948 [Xylaria grammica]